ncbi:MAG: nitroreductase family protein [Chloroflexi bacterium]|nr:nitroreductase family protein [Chloroflexota bacterium]
MATDYENLLDLVRRRRSTRRYKPDPVADGDIEKIIEVARWAMSGANAQPWEFVVVKDGNTRAEIFELYKLHRTQTDVFNKLLPPELKHPVTGTLKAGQPSFRDAPVFIVVCGDSRTLLATSLSAEIMGYERTTYHFNLANATMLVHLAAASLGLGTQWISTSPIWEGKLKTLLGIPDWFTVPHLAPLGYRDYTPPPPYRREVSEILHREEYEQSKFRTDEQVLEYIALVRNRARAAYYIPPEKGKK